MNKLLIGVVAAAAATTFVSAPAVAHADWPACSTMTTPIGIQVCNQQCTSNPTPACNVTPAVIPGPAGSPNDSCQWLLNNPQAHAGAYEGCETARRATGSP